MHASFHSGPVARKEIHVIYHLTTFAASSDYYTKYAMEIYCNAYTGGSGSLPLVTESCKGEIDLGRRSKGRLLYNYVLPTYLLTYLRSSFLLQIFMHGDKKDEM